MRAQLCFVALAALAAGCSSPPDFTPAGDDMALPPGEGGLAPMQLEGRIVGLDKQPLAGVAVSLCQTSCRETATGALGEFAFPDVVPAFYTLRARKPAADYAELDFPLYLSDSSYSRLTPLVLPRVSASAAVTPGPQSFSVDADLTLALDGSDLSLPQGGAAGRLGGVRIPTDLFPNFCVPSARVLAMWAFSPTGVTSPAPIGITLSEGLGLPPGAQVRFIAIDPKDGRPAVVADGAVSADGKSLHTTTGSGLHRLNWLLVSVLSGGP